MKTAADSCAAQCPVILVLVAPMVIAVIAVIASLLSLRSFSHRFLRLTNTVQCVRLCVEVTIVATNLQLDDRLIRQAVRLGGHPTKRAAVTQALTDYVRFLQQQKVLGLFGKMEFDPTYDYKKQRSRA
jgi:Arc/MetJ family transcription regulator